MKEKLSPGYAEAGQGGLIIRLTGTFLGGALVLNSFLARALFAETELAGVSALIGAVILGAPIISDAIKDLVRGEKRMTELVALALIACFALEDYQTAGIVAFFMLMAGLVERRAALGAHEALEKLLLLRPQKARLLGKDGTEVEVEAENLSSGETILIRPGENIPADGVILGGASAIDEATITGESMPADKGASQEVFAGTANLTSLLKVRVSQVGPDTILGKVRALIIKAQETRLPIMRLMDRYIGWYTPLVVMIAGAIFFFTREATRAVTALVVSCPTAVILAMPTAMVAALSCAARMGVLIKNIGDIEIAGNLSAIAFDKTGTLTTGELVVRRLFPGKSIPADEFLKTVASVERNSNHPMAKAVVQVAKEARLNFDECNEFKEVAGRGVEGVTGGKLVLIGKKGWLAEQGIDCAGLHRPEMEGLSTLYVAREKECIGCIGLEDKTRREARDAVDELKKLGIRQVIMFTGDRKAVAKRISEELGCTAFVAECLPERKLRLVEEFKKKGHLIAVVGDGVNDAPALAAGDIGVAMGAAGNDIAINSATIALMSPDLRRLPFLVRLSQRAMRIVYENLSIGVMCVIAGLTLSGLGIFTPIIAAIFYLISSLIVIFNSARLVGYE